MRTILKPFVLSCTIEANCPRCGDIYCANYNAFTDEDVIMECGNCHQSTVYFISEPIPVPLRYRSSGQPIGRTRKPRPRRQSDVLPGQLKFGGF